MRQRLTLHGWLVACLIRYQNTLREKGSIRVDARQLESLNGFMNEIDCG
jgi:hypothetical protein